MKKILYSFFVCALAVSLAACSAKQEPSDNTNGDEINQDDSNGGSGDENSGNEQKPNNPVVTVELEAVDLGLSVKWANMNIGAKDLNQTGRYFAWGEVETKSAFASGSYQFKVKP